MSLGKIVLAYSGGLDTSCILKILQQRGYEVIAYIADVGQKEDFVSLEKRALETGASKVYVENLQREFVTDFIFPAIAGNAVYEGRYLLGTSLARPLIARRQIEIALKEGAEFVSHGSTGKGNDQVRFELAYAALAPELKVIAPWKEAGFLEKFKGRQDLIRYAKEHAIPVEATAEKPYSTDENLMHKSYEAGMLEDPLLTPPAEIFRLTNSPRTAPEEGCRLKIQFKDALPISVENLDDGTRKEDPHELFSYLNDLGGTHAIGRIDIVENRFVGIKSRGVYETPAGTILHNALRDLEGIAMDREVVRLRNGLAPKFAELIYNGFWFSPEMDFLRAAFAQAEALIDGYVNVELYKGNVTILGRFSPNSLYNQELSSMDVEGGYDQKDAAGFIQINSLRLRAHKVILGD
ncbi:MAG: argininosuccinate synthase [Myxococcales bacterium]|nr:argininosuccinate synthase [Myxococcales bacterium]MCB9644484.1 argininosuccinate synthase [Myxococcales bacterium]